MAKAIQQELHLRQNYLNNESLETIYFGGGTPSLLDISVLQNFLIAINKLFKVDENPEITLEANPDDLSITYLQGLREIGFNRLSVGIQSFNDGMLKQINRKHNAQQAVQCVLNAQKIGFRNINIDLIYGLPELSISDWKHTLKKAFELNIQHISAYHLTIEPNTAFNHFNKRGMISLPSENESLQQFNMLINETEKKGFQHYEISNFALPGFHSKHNTSYWMQKKYLGVGPSAHSYNMISRQWNISNNKIYIDNINSGKEFFESETLNPKEKYNDYILTSLRTMWGVNLKYIDNNFGSNYLNYCKKEAQKYIESGHLYKHQSKFILTPKGKFIADKIASDLFKT